MFTTTHQHISSSLEPPHTKYQFTFQTPHTCFFSFTTTYQYIKFTFTTIQKHITPPSPPHQLISIPSPLHTNILVYFYHHTPTYQFTFTTTHQCKSVHLDHYTRTYQFTTTVTDQLYYSTLFQSTNAPIGSVATA